MCAQPSPKQTERADARARFRKEWRSKEGARRRSPSTRPRGNQDADRGDIERGVARIWAVVGR
jgi:hypothetical protein